MKYRFERGGTTYDIDVEVRPDGYLLRGPEGEPQLVRLETRPDGSQRAITPWGELELVSARRGPELWAQIAGRRLSARVERARPAGAGGPAVGAPGALCAPMAGKLLRLDVKLGDPLKAGQAVAVIEAMKMENELVAPHSGVVIEVGATAPSTLEKGALIIRISVGAAAPAGAEP